MKGIKISIPKTIIIGGAGRIGKAFLSIYREICSDCIGTTRNQTKKNLHYLDLLSCDISPLKLSQRGYTDAVISAGIANSFSSAIDLHRSSPTST